MKQVTASLLSFSILLAAPGLRSGQAFAQVVAPRAAQGAPVGVMTVPAGVGSMRPVNAALPTAAATLSLPSVLPSAAAPTVHAVLPAAAKAAAAPSLALPVQAAVVQAAPAAAPLAAAAAPQAAVAAPQAAVAAQVGALSRRVSVSIESAGNISAASPADAHSLGGRLEAILGGWRSAASAASPVAPQGRDWGGPGSDRYFGNPAGQDSIAGAVRSHNARFGSAEAPAPAPEPAPEAPRPVKNTPFVPKLISAALAFLPAVALGLPLIAAGAPLAGYSILGASVMLMTLPFMGQNTPKAVRAIPGVALLGLGGLTLVSGFMGGASLWMGAFVTLGGWGLIRYGVLSDESDRYDRDKALTAYFGALGAVLGAGLSLSGAAMLIPVWSHYVPFLASAWVVNGATWVAYPLTALLFLHLPGWVGEGIEAMFRGVHQSGRGIYRVMGALKRDTVLRERLTAFTKKHLQSSPWNAIWLSGIWIPVWVSEAAMFALAVAGGLVTGALVAAPMFAWGAVHKLFEKSAATRFLGEWNHFVFDWSQGSKVRTYNVAAKPLIAYINKTPGFLGFAASVGLRLMQVAWLAYAVLGLPVVMAVGFLRAFGRTGVEYDPARHSPDYLRIDTKDTPDTERPSEPSDPSRPVKSTLMPRLIATAIAALPLYFLALPLAAAPFVGQLYVLTALALAAMPFLPAASPKWVKMLPGLLLAGLGVTTAVAVPYFVFNEVSLVMTLATQNAFWMGLVTALSGWGMARYAANLGQKDGQKWYSVDDPEYIGAFFGALGVITGLGVSVLGMTGWFPLALKVGGYLTSGLLLIHLPHWVGAGVRTAAEGGWSSVRAFERVLTFWSRDTSFYTNIRRHASYWLDKSVWNGSWLSVIWVPTWALQLVEWAAALVLGLAAGLLRLPLNFLWGAAYDLAPDARATRFIAGFAKSTFDLAEGSKKTVFDRWVAKLVPVMNESHPVSGRPTAAAALAFAVARLAQLAWLARLVFWAPAILVLSLLAGFKNASGDKLKPGEGDEWKPDADNPGVTY